MSDRCFACDRKLPELTEVCCAKCVGDLREKVRTLTSENQALKAFKAKMVGGLSSDDLEIACKNIGYDLTCGQCAAVFFTGMGTYEHDAGCKTPTAMDLLAEIRAKGWSVAVHNDYRQNEEAHTFWLFTRGGSALKGEGRTDREALEQVLRMTTTVDEHEHHVAELKRLEWTP